MRTLLAFSLALVAATPAAWAKKKAAAAPKQASAQTARAISDLAGKFKWDMSPDDVMKLVFEEKSEEWNEKIQKEKIVSKQQELLKGRDEALRKLKDNYVKFDGKKTGWDVSLIDREFAQGNDESMYVKWEDSQRRFLFFHDGKLWKQFIALDAANPIFAGKSFDDFAELIQKRYGPAAMTFKSKRTSDEQQLDHLEWPPAGDYLLWAIDYTALYGNFCLSLIKRSALPEVEKSRVAHNSRPSKGNAMIDQLTKGDSNPTDANADVVDDITGRKGSGGGGDESGNSPAAAPKKGKGPAKKQEKKESDDPLEGMKF